MLLGRNPRCGLHGVTVVARQGRWKVGIGAEVGRSLHAVHESARERGQNPGIPRLGGHNDHRVQMPRQSAVFQAIGVARDRS